MPEEPSTPPSESEVQYWDRVLAADSGPLSHQEEWLRCCRRMYASWVERYLPGPLGTVLKTDAFEESRGLELWEALAAKASRMVTIDVAASAMLPARRRVQQQTATVAAGWALSEAQRLPFASSSFDSAVSFSTLDHFQTTVEIAQSLAELARVTRPGGRLLLTLDNPGNPVLALRNRLPHGVLSGAGVSPYRYGVTVSAGELGRMAEAAGWHVEERRMVLHSPRVLCVALSRWAGEGRVLSPGLYWTTVTGWEWLGALPTRQITGHFTLIAARRRRA